MLWELLNTKHWMPLGERKKECCKEIVHVLCDKRYVSAD